MQPEAKKLERKKRTKYETLYDIFQILKATDGEKKTHIMYKANMSYFQLNNYINMLIDKELVQEKSGLYFLTEKGLLLYDILNDYFEKKEAMEQDLTKLKEYIGDIDI